MVKLNYLDIFFRTKCRKQRQKKWFQRKETKGGIRLIYCKSVLRSGKSTLIKIFYSEREKKGWQPRYNVMKTQLELSQSTLKVAF